MVYSEVTSGGGTESLEVEYVSILKSMVYLLSLDEVAVFSNVELRFLLEVTKSNGFL